MREVRALIRIERLKRRWTLDDFAQKLGVSASYLSTIESGKAKLSIDKANEMLKHFGFRCSITIDPIDPHK